MKLDCNEMKVKVYYLGSKVGEYSFFGGFADWLYSIEKIHSGVKPLVKYYIDHLGRECVYRYYHLDGGTVYSSHILPGHYVSFGIIKLQLGKAYQLLRDGESSGNIIVLGKGRPDMEYQIVVDRPD